MSSKLDNERSERPSNLGSSSYKRIQSANYDRSLHYRGNSDNSYIQTNAYDPYIMNENREQTRKPRIEQRNESDRTSMHRRVQSEQINQILTPNQNDGLIHSTTHPINNCHLGRQQNYEDKRVNTKNIATESSKSISPPMKRAMSSKISYLASKYEPVSRSNSVDATGALQDDFYNQTSEGSDYSNNGNNSHGRNVNTVDTSRDLSLPQRRGLKPLTVVTQEIAPSRSEQKKLSPEILLKFTPPSSSGSHKQDNNGHSNAYNYSADRGYRRTHSDQINVGSPFEFTHASKQKSPHSNVHSFKQTSPQSLAEKQQMLLKLQTTATLLADEQLALQLHSEMNNNSSYSPVSTNTSPQSQQCKDDEDLAREYQNILNASSPHSSDKSRYSWNGHRDTHRPRHNRPLSTSAISKDGTASFSSDKQQFSPNHSTDKLSPIVNDVSNKSTNTHAPRSGQGRNTPKSSHLEIDTGDLQLEVKKVTKRMSNVSVKAPTGRADKLHIDTSLSRLNSAQNSPFAVSSQTSRRFSEVESNSKPTSPSNSSKLSGSASHRNKHSEPSTPLSLTSQKFSPAISNNDKDEKAVAAVVISTPLSVLSLDVELVQDLQVSVQEIYYFEQHQRQEAGLLTDIGISRKRLISNMLRDMVSAVEVHASYLYYDYDQSTTPQKTSPLIENKRMSRTTSANCRTEAELVAHIAAKEALKEQKREKKRAFKKEQKILERQIQLENTTQQQHVQSSQQSPQQQQSQAQFIAVPSPMKLTATGQNNSPISTMSTSPVFIKTPNINRYSISSMFTRTVTTQSPSALESSNSSPSRTLYDRFMQYLEPNGYDTTPIIPYNVVVRYVTPISPTEVPVMLHQPDNEEGLYRDMQSKQDEQLYVSKLREINRSRAQFELRKKEGLLPVLDAFSSFMLIGKQWLSATASVDSVEGGICISIILPHLKNLHIEVVNSSKNCCKDILTIEALRSVFYGDRHACDENCLYFGRFTLDMFTVKQTVIGGMKTNSPQELTKEHISYIYSSDVGMLFIYVDRVQLHEESARTLAKKNDKLALPLLDQLSPRYGHKMPYVNVTNTPTTRYMSIGSMFSLKRGNAEHNHHKHAVNLVALSASKSKSKSTSDQVTSPTLSTAVSLQFYSQSGSDKHNIRNADSAFATEINGVSSQAKRVQSNGNVLDALYLNPSMSRHQSVETMLKPDTSSDKTIRGSGKLSPLKRIDSLRSNRSSRSDKIVLRDIDSECKAYALNLHRTSTTTSPPTYGKRSSNDTIVESPSAIDQEDTTVGRALGSYTYGSRDNSPEVTSMNKPVVRTNSSKPLSTVAAVKQRSGVYGNYSSHNSDINIATTRTMQSETSGTTIDRESYAYMSK